MRKTSLLTSGLLTCLLIINSPGTLKAQSISFLKNDLNTKFASLINHSDTCEAYPYLSADGLRLYFTGDYEDGFGRIYYCSRNSVNENFNKPVILSKNITDGFFCSTLTADELTLYMANQGDVYVSKRKSLNSEFSKPEMVKGLVEGWKFAPTISPDGNELILIKDLTGKGDETYTYKKITDTKFIQTGTLLHPTGFLTPGQFSKDGLSYYVAFETSDSKTPEGTINSSNINQILIRYTRKSLDNKFETIEELPAAANPAKRNHQPTVNGDGSIMIIVNTEKNDWKYNELRLINFNIDEKIADTLVDTLRCALLVEEIKVDTIPNTAIICWLDTATIFDSFRQVYASKFLEFDTTIFLDTIFCTFGGNDLILSSITNIEITSPEAAPQIKVYPNPFINNLTITIESKNLNSNFELYDISGRRLIRTKLNNTVNRIDFNKPGAGAYFYNIRAMDGQVILTGKLIKK